MSINGWLQEFRALHKRARLKQLNEEDKRLYLQAREQFARALTAAQGMTLKPGEMARQTFRVAQAMQVELSLNTGILRAMTLDISKGGFSVVRDYVGHGIGARLHEDPQIPNYGKPRTGPRLKAGMTFAVEAMINAGTHAVRTLSDGWTVVTQDRKVSAHYEDTIAITENGPEVLTCPSGKRP